MIALGLGSNLGDRERSLVRAVEALRKVMNEIRVSPIYESRALLPAGAGDDWDLPFLNLAVAGTTALNPHAFLRAAKEIERSLGRREGDRWAPREIDIDLLCVGDTVLDDPDLVLPHPGLLARDFALVPLADVCPSWTYPRPGAAFGKTAQALSTELASTLRRTDFSLA